MNTKLVWMRWFPADFRESTITMSLAERAAYIYLIGAAWDGPLPADPEKLRRIAGVDTGDDWPAIWAGIRDRFIPCEGGLTHDRIERDRLAQQSLHDRYSQRASRAAQARWQHASSMQQASDKQCVSNAVQDQDQEKKIDTEVAGDRGVRGERGPTPDPKPVDNPAPKAAPKPSGRKRPSTPLPEGFNLTQDRKVTILRHLPDADPQAVLDQFISWHTAKDSRFASWDQALVTWLLKDKESGKYPRSARHTGANGSHRPDPWQTSTGLSLMAQGKHIGFRPPHAHETPASYRTAMAMATPAQRTSSKLDLTHVVKEIPK